MTVTMDTNVLFAALHSRKGASHAILQLIITQQITLALSVSVYFEYEAVLTRPEKMKLLELSREHITDLLDFIALLAQKQNVYYLLRPNLPDETDNLFWECAFASKSQFLITANARDFQNPQLAGFSFAVVTPAEFFARWRTRNV